MSQPSSEVSSSGTDPLSPEARRVLEAAPSRPARSQLTVEQNRDSMLAQREAFGPGARLWSVTDTELPGRGPHTPVRVYRPGEEQRPVLVYVHGGGWALGDLDTHDGLCRNLAAAADCVVVAVDYARPPEEPFPRAVDDVLDAVRAVAQGADALGGDGDRVGVGGDSAGGNLAAVAAQQLRGEVDLAHQLLIYPVTDADPDAWPSYTECAAGPGLTADDMRWYFRQYVADDQDRRDPRLAPYRCADLTGVAPATVITASWDPLRDEGEAYAERLKQAGVPVRRRRFEQMFHPFMLYESLGAAREAVAFAGERLREAFARTR